MCNLPENSSGNLYQDFRGYCIRQQKVNLLYVLAQERGRLTPAVSCAEAKWRAPTCRARQRHLVQAVRPTGRVIEHCMRASIWVGHIC